MSTTTIKKTLSTCYALGIADYTRTGPVVTNRGKELQQSSVGNRKTILAEELLQIPLVRAYCEEAPNEPFDAEELMGQVSDKHLKGWSEVTIETRVKRLSPWLTYTGLAEKQSPGELTLTEQVNQQAIAPS
jgi:hypothetical protein